MTIRYIVRPKGIKLTADALKLETGAQAVVLTDELVNTKFNPKLDLLIGLPRAARLEGLTEGQLASYHQLRGFYTSSKFAQRKAMHEGGVNIPSTLFINQHEPTIGKKYVVRPMSHRAGSGFSVVRAEDLQYNPWTHYAAELFTRTHEFRVLYSHGKRLGTIAKRMPEGVAQEKPWNHEAGAFFYGIGDSPKLTALGAYAALDAFFVCQQAHICGVDVMVSNSAYAVTEINFGPSLSVPARLKLVGDHLKAHYAAA